MHPLALIVEDEAPLRTIYELSLVKLDYEVVQAADGEQALELLAYLTPDVIFLDMLLPRVSGSAVLEYIYSMPHLANTHVVVVTAHSRFNHAQMLRPEDSFLLKPIYPHDIQRAAQRSTAST